MDFNLWLEQSWLIIVAIIGGVTLVWNFFNKTVREIRTEIKKPFEEINNKLDIITKDNELIKNATLSSQRKELLDTCETCLKNGFATIERQQAISEMYNTYHALGGDSWVTDLVHRVCALPVADPRINKTILNENK